MTHSHAVDHVRSAAFALCGDAGLAPRLEHAHLHLAAVDRSDVPASLSARLDELIADLGYGGDTVRQALARMNTSDMDHLARRIVSLYGDLCRQLPAED
ncbi:hypothetical protein ACFFGH_16845 [Lysobacter korlensis]|uniref:Uncharacterized protein n=1 Tax=Lysobacter korlensis TaxID=553636 RepID=A0ABV6RRA1_9GAMM